MSLVATLKELAHHKGICTKTRDSGIIKVNFKHHGKVVGTEGSLLTQKVGWAAE